MAIAPGIDSIALIECLVFTENETPENNDDEIT
jgi:hypothetical protein